MAPSVRLQTSLPAGLSEESFAVPAPFDGDLGKQKAATATLGNEQPMPSDNNQSWINGLQRRKDTYIHFQISCFFSGYGWKPGIVECRRLSRFGNSSVEGIFHDDVSDTAAQFAVEVQGGKGAARLSDVLGRRSEVEPGILELGGYAAVRQVQQDAAFFGRVFEAGRYRGR